MNEEIFTLEEACSFLKISLNTGYAWIKSGRLLPGEPAEMERVAITAY
ncbi:helix-turn-helix domain-containing protein [Hafnia alvei]